MFEHKDTLRWLVLVLVAGLVVRVAWLLDLSDLPVFYLPQTDDFVYDLGARRIADGDLALMGDPLRFGAPYFYVLGAIHALFGAGPWAPRFVQIALGLVTLLATFDTTRRLTDERMALATTGLMAFYGPLVFFEGLLLPETLQATVHALLVWLLVGSTQLSSNERMTKAWTAIGALLGLAIGLRPNALLLLAPVAAALYAAPPRLRARLGMLAVAGFVLVTAPLVVRNVIAVGEPFGAQTAGVNLFIGNGPGASGIFRVPVEVPGAASPLGQFEGFHEAAEAATGRTLSFGESDAHWRDLALSHMAAHPLDATLLLLRKVRFFWNTRELSALVPYDFVRRLSPTLGAPLPQFGWIGPLALLGAAIAARTKANPERAAGRRIPLLGVIVGTLGTALFFVQDRYRIATLPCFFVLFGLGLDWLVRSARERSLPERWPLAALLVGLALAWPAVGLRPRLERSYTELANGYADLGRTSDARDAFEHALEADTHYLPALIGVAQISHESEAWARVRAEADAQGDAAARRLADEASAATP